MRGIYTAGVLDVFMEQGICLDGVIGVSAGAPEGANLNTKKRILHFFKKVVAVVVKFSK